MPTSLINIGSTPNDGTGNPIRTAFGIVNENFDIINAALFAGTEPSIITALSVTGDTILSNTWVNADVIVGNTIQSNGALITGNVTIVGNLNVIGSQVASQSQQSSAPILDIHFSATPYVANDNKDIGIKWQYYDSTNKEGFLGWQNTSKSLVYMDNITTVANIVTAGSFGNVQFGELLLSNTTPATSSNTGALKVTGGISTQGNLHVGDQLVATTANIGNLSITGYHVGSLNFAGGDTIYINGSPVQTAGTAFNGGTVGLPTWFTDNTPSTSSTTGAVRIIGGLGVNGNIFAGGNIVVPIGTTNSFQGNLQGNVIRAAQPFITSLGTLTGLTVAGQISSFNVSPSTNLNYSLGTGTSNRWLKIWAFDADFSGTLTGTTVNSTGGTHTGPTVFDINSSLDAVRITQTGTGDALVVEDSTNPDSSPFVVGSTGKVSIGLVPTFTNAKLMVSDTGTDATAFFGRASADSVGFQQRFYKTRSTNIYVRSVVSSNDSIGLINFNADDGTQEVTAAQIGAAVDGVAGTNDMPGRLVFTTTPDGSASPVERMRISSNGSVILSGNLFINGSGSRAITHAGDIIPTSNLTANIGSSTAWYNTFFGISTQAKYADLAEIYRADANYEPGTVVIFGGKEEITVTSDFADHRIAGVISTDPAYLMNAMASGLPVALRGRVPVKVTGPVNKGDLLVTSTSPGLATSVGSDTGYGLRVFAKSLETNPANGIKIIEAVII